MSPSHRRALPQALLLAVLAAALVLTVGPSPAGAHQVPATGELKCHNPRRAWTEIASASNSFAIGNCRNGTRYFRVRHSNTGNTTRGWEIGRITGSFDGCGVVKRNESKVVHGDTRTTDCDRDPAQKRADVASATDCAPAPGLKNRRCRWDRIAHGDTTTKVVVPEGCPIYANVRPFSMFQDTQPRDQVGWIVPNQNRYRFRMRYITRDGRFALGFLGNPKRKNSEVSTAPRRMPQWVFTPSGCISKPHLEGIGDDMTDK